MAYKKGKETRELILKGSKKLFLSHGYQNTTYKMIGDMLGINSNLIPYYFKDKSTLAQLILEEFFLAEDQFINSLPINDRTPMLTYTIRNRVHYQILADNPGLFRFYKAVVSSGSLEHYFLQSAPIHNMYQEFFTFYHLPKLYPDEYYLYMETGSEAEILQHFTPDMAGNELFLRFIISIFPTFISVPQEEIDDAMIESKDMSSHINYGSFVF